MDDIRFHRPRLRAPSRSTLLRLAIGAAAVGALALVRPGVIIDTLTSPRALLLVVATVLASRLLARAARQFGQRPAALAGWLPIVLVGWFFLVPYFRSTALHEQLPAASAVVPAPSAPAPEAATLEAAAPVAVSVTVATPTALPGNTQAPAPPGPAAVPPSTALVLASGSLRGIGHRAGGAVSTYRLAEGGSYVRFDGVDIENAPDPVVYLVRGAGRTSPGDGVRLGALKASRGSFNYPVPAGFDTANPFTVLVWCGRFATPIANATQAR